MADSDAYIMPLPDDMDADGIADEVDNCPTAPNTNQRTKTATPWATRATHAPIDVDNTDTDGDGVGDKCDPHVGTIGDKILIFEGFKSGIPTGWAIGFAPDRNRTTMRSCRSWPNNHTALVPDRRRARERHADL